MAKGSRRFWAEEILLRSMWDRLKRRVEIRRWSKQILQTELKKVMEIKGLITEIIKNGIEQSDKNRRLEKVEEQRRIRGTGEKEERSGRECTTGDHFQHIRLQK